MDEIKITYKKRKKLYFGLIAGMLALVIIFRLTAAAGGPKATPANFLKFACLVGVILAARGVFRCPKCEVTLASAFYSSWCKLRYCPKCGVALEDD